MILSLRPYRLSRLSIASHGQNRLTGVLRGIRGTRAIARMTLVESTAPPRDCTECRRRRRRVYVLCACVRVRVCARARVYTYHGSFRSDKPRALAR